MAEFIFKSTIYGHQVFTVPDGGGVVELKGRKLAVDGYLGANSNGSALLADKFTLEIVARAWWKRRNAHLSVFGHKAYGIEP